MLISNVRRTWAPAGKTPILRHHYRRDKISAISSLTVSPRGWRLGFFVRFHSNNITGVEVVRFLRHLLRHLRGPVVLLWDGGKIHRGKTVNDFLERNKRLRMHRFPAYAPELNPVEQVWTHGKRDLSNSADENVGQMGTHLRRSLQRVQNSQRLLWSCIEHSELPWP